MSLALSFKFVTFHYVLQEFDFEEAFKLAKRVDKIIAVAVQSISTSIKTFKNIVTSVQNVNIDNIIEEFVDVVKKMPRHVFNFRKVSKRLLKAIDKYAILPPVFYQIKDFVQKVTNIFNDVKHDVMTLYNVSKYVN